MELRLKAYAGWRRHASPLSTVRLLSVLTLFSLIVFSVEASADIPPAEDLVCLQVSPEHDSANLLPHLYHYVDETRALQSPWIDSSATRDLTFERTGITSAYYSFGTEGRAHWFRFCVTNSASEAVDLVASFFPPLLQEFDFYPQQEGEQSYRTGNARPFETRQKSTQNYDFGLQIAAGDTHHYYFRTRVTYNALLNATLWSEQAFESQQFVKNVIFGITLGIVLGLALYNLLLYFSLPNASTLYFVLFAVMAIMGAYFWEGWVQQLVFPQSPGLSYDFFQFNRAITIALGALFSREFLGLKQFKVLDWALLVALGIFVLLELVVVAFDPALFLIVCAAHAFATILFFTGFAIYSLAYQDNKQAFYYLLALGPLLLREGFWSLASLGYFQGSYVPFESSMAVAAAMILLAYGVGQTIATEKAMAQKQALEQLQISNELKSNYSAQLEEELERNTAEIRAMNVNLEQQAAQLVELDAAKTRFFTNISHEFRTPLTLIQGPLQMLREEESDAHKQESISNVMRNAKQLQGLIDKLLELSKFDGDSMVLQASRHDLVQTIRNFTSQFHSFAEREGVQLTFNSREESLPIYIDYDKLQMVMNNLLGNALKFTPKGGEITVEVELASASTRSFSASTIAGPAQQEIDEFSTDHYAQIKVTDTGCGIVASHLPHVFDRYFQSSANQHHQTGAGTGVGLALSKELVELHIGQISVSSIEKAGTCFTVMLPLGKAHLNFSEIVTREAPSDEESSTEQVVSAAEEPIQLADDAAPCVLVVDDNRDMREYLRGILAKEYRVLEAEDAYIAESLIVQHEPAIIITDLMMPGRSGLELIEQVRQKNNVATTPIIMLTAKAGQEDRMRGLQASADDYLAKPFDANELKARIRNLLLRHQQLKAFYRAADAQADAEVEEADDLLQKLRCVVEARITEADFGVEDLAKEVAMSAPTLRRKIAELSSFTPSGFIQHCRLERARQLSQEGNMRTLAELAQSVGFSQPNYFSRLYRKTFNQAPLGQAPLSVDESPQSDT